MKVHHIGYAVKKIEKAAEVFKSLGYTCGEVKEDTLRSIKIMFAENGTERVELVAPIGSDTPVSGILKGSGPAPYHICYEVGDIEKSIEELSADGWMLVHAPLEAPAIGGAPVAFLYNRHIGMIELVEIK